MKSNLFRHLRTRHRQPNDESKSEQTRHELCSTCGKLYKSKYGLSLHKKEFKYHCNVCNKGFNTLWNYKGHLASHDKVLREKCDTCGAVFQYKKKLVAHKKICRINNQEESEIVCSTCKTKIWLMSLTLIDFARYKSLIEQSCSCTIRYFDRSDSFCVLVTWPTTISDDTLVFLFNICNIANFYV